MKKTLVIIAVIILFAVTCIPALAAEDSSLDQNIIPMRFTYILTHAADIGIDGNGLASVTSDVETNQDATIKITGYLQRYSGGTWSNVRSWSQTEYSTDWSTMDKSYYVTSGYYYRYKSVTTVTVNGNNESSTVYTSSEYY